MRLYLEVNLGFWDVLELSAIFAAFWVISAQVFGSHHVLRNAFLGLLGAVAAVIIADIAGFVIRESNVLRWALELGGVLLTIFMVERFA